MGTDTAAPEATRVAPNHGRDYASGSDKEDTPFPVCTSAPRPRIKAGEYEAECVEARTYRDPQFRRWLCRLKFSLIPGGEKIYGFLNLGNGGKPHAGRRSEYHRAWVIANGSQPRKGQPMSQRVFTQKLFEVEVGDTTKRFDQSDHPEPEIYSTIKKIRKLNYP